MKEEKNISDTDEGDNIDIIVVLKEFWGARRLIIKTTLVFTFIGLFIAVFSEKQYTSSTTFVPMSEGKSVSSDLGGLASLAGINLGGGSVNNSEISPELYPLIVNSIYFQKELLQTPLLIEGQDTLVSYKSYYKNIYKPGVLEYLTKYTVGLPSVIISLFRGNHKENNIVGSNEINIVSVSAEESSLIKQLEGQISLEINKKEGYIAISTTMPEAIASSQLTLKAQEILQKYALKFKTQKSIDQLKYIEARFLEKEKEFNVIKLKLASFQDQNNSINTALGKTKLIQLESDYALTFSIYSELAKQLETQLLKVKKDTPLFTVLKPVIIPINKSEPKRFRILLMGFLFGFFISLGLVKAKHIYNNFKKT